MEIKSVTILQETDQAGLFISGSAAGRNVLYTCEELERQEKNSAAVFLFMIIMKMRKARILRKGVVSRCRTIWMLHV